MLSIIPFRLSPAMNRDQTLMPGVPSGEAALLIFCRLHANFHDKGIDAVFIVIVAQ